MTVLRGIGATVEIALNTLVCATLLLTLAVIKLIAPFNAVRKPVDRALNAIAELWIRNNSRLLRGIRWDVSGAGTLERKRWYLVVANHQSWADIFVLQHVLTGRIPFLKFFLKRELIRVPVIGLAWWALDYPFMKRHSEEFLRQHPERRGDDLVTIRKACEKFSLIPTAVMNFAEGTRFTAERHAASESPYRNLLPAKAGGLALAIDAMGELFHSLVDVTIFYPGGVPSFFDLLAGRVKEVVVTIRERPIPRELIGGDYAADPGHRDRVRRWVSQLWVEKDAELDGLRAGRTA